MACGSTVSATSTVVTTCCGRWQSRSRPILQLPPYDQAVTVFLGDYVDRGLGSMLEHGKLVVHGHTPSPVPEIRFNRIGIDTAGYATGRMTCLVLEKNERRFLYVGGP